MTLGTWTPDEATPAPPDIEMLTEAARLGRAGVDAPFPTEPPEALTPLHPWMKRHQGDWRPVLEPLATDLLVDLTRFFTLAEHHWAGWSGGEKNPVVWICKVLKQRDAFPDADLIHWIKAHTENRYLPYGNPLA